MFSLSLFDPWNRSPEAMKRREEARRSRKESALKSAVPWDEKMKHRPLICVQAATYKPHSLFEVNAWPLADAGALPSGREYYASSRKDSFRYVENLLPRGTTLLTWNSKGSGHVAFDGDVVIPTLYERRMNSGYGHDRSKWRLPNPSPWMSLTPAEIWSLRNGTSLAKGHTVVAGLGLGWQLERVLLRRQVTQVTLVEKSSELVEWLLSEVMKRVPSTAQQKLRTVHTDDAYERLPKLTADVALVDIYAGWGGNSFPHPCPDIGKVWVWGSAEMRGEGGYGSRFLREMEPW